MGVNRPKKDDKINPKFWEVPNAQEAAEYYERKKNQASKGSVIKFERYLSQIDVYCYLKARFGEPNGLANLFKSPTSDNYIHWEYLLKCDNTFISIMGIGRTIQIVIDESLDQNSWRTLVENFREEFRTEGSIKSATLRNLEEWVEFINRYSELCNEASAHFDKIEKLKGFDFNMLPYPQSESDYSTWLKSSKKKGRVFGELRHSCLVLKLITPVMLEAFINLIILVACKPEIRKNKTIYEARVREEMHVKVPALHLTCAGFKTAIDTETQEYKNFARIMNNRNWFFHGNADPKKDKIETVFLIKTHQFLKKQETFIACILEK